MILSKFKYPIAAIFLTVSAEAITASSHRRVAILGDSLSTGAATHPDLVYDPKVLWNILSGKTSLRQLDPGLRPAQRLLPSFREWNNAFDGVLGFFWFTAASLFLDTPEYSWGYLTALGLGVDGSDVLIAAANGARVGALRAQVNRVLDATRGELPDEVLLLFGGNDICGPTLDSVPRPEVFEEEIYRGVRYLLINGRTPARAVRISLV